MAHFNDLMRLRIGAKDLSKRDWMPVVKTTKPDFNSAYMDKTVNSLTLGGVSKSINGQLAKGCLVDASGNDLKLRWYN